MEMQSGDNYVIKSAIQEAIDLYQEALELPTNNGECRLLCHRELIKAYGKQEKLSTLKQLKLYFFDLELENVDRVLYYTKPNSAEAKVLISRGPQYFSRLRLLLQEETSENKAGYLEKVFVGMNAVNTEFRIRLAWQISKAYYKQTIKKVDLD